MNFKLNFKYFTSGILIILIMNYSIFLGLTEDKKTDVDLSSSTKITAELGNVKKSIEVVGNAELVDEQSLSFNKAGTIIKVNFKAGDTVSKGDTIAEIDNSDAYDSIEEAKISLENSQISLNQLYKEVDESRIIEAQNSITTSQNNLNNSQIELENLKITQENNLSKLLDNIDTSKKELANLIKEKENNLEDTNYNKNKTIINIEDDFRLNLVEIEKIIEESDYIMGVTTDNKRKNDDFEDYLGAKDTGTKSNAKLSLLESIELYNTLKKSVEDYDYSGDKDGIEFILNEYIDVFNKLYVTTNYIYQAAENSIVSTTKLSESDIYSIKSKMSTYRSNSLNKVSSIKNSIITLNTLTDTDLIGTSNEITIEKQTISIKNEIKNYDETISKYELEIDSKLQNIESKKISLEVSKLNLEELLEGPTDDNVTKANNSIKQSNIKLSSAYENLEDYMLQAPFDGIIRKIDYMVGDNLSNDTSKYIYIENPNLLEVSVMLDQIDIVNVQIGDLAVVTFDSYATIPVDAKISNIDTTPLKTSGVVSYEVKLILDDPDFDKKVLSGMTADVEIINEFKENILLIKTSAIKTMGDKKIVIISKDGKEEKVEIETGLSGDGKTEIISGLEVGDEIMIGEFKINGGEEATTLFSTPTSGRGQGGGRP